MSRLFVGGLSDDVSSADLRYHFVNFGSLKEAWVAREGGYGFVEYYSDSDASNALASRNGSLLCGITIRVNYARPKHTDPGVKRQREDNRTCYLCGVTGHIKVDCPNKTSVNISNHQRSQRIVTSVNCPAHWPLQVKQGQRIKVSNQNYHAQLERNFKVLIGEAVTVLKIEEVCNSEFYEKYEMKKKNMMKNLSNKINEKLLYHGTEPNIIDAICVQNFDFRLSGKNATAYGKGSYFSTSAAYSHRYTTEDGAGVRHMFLANVLVGKYVKGDSTMNRPPPLSAGNHVLYDTTVDDIFNPSIFVVFERDQVYPKYIISYKVGLGRSTKKKPSHPTQTHRSTKKNPSHPTQTLYCTPTSSYQRISPSASPYLAPYGHTPNRAQTSSYQKLSPASSSSLSSSDPNNTDTNVKKSKGCCVIL